MAAEKANVSVAAQVILDRYSAEKDVNGKSVNKVGQSAFESLDKIPNNDPSEAQWNLGDEVQMPPLETLKACAIIRPFNGRSLPAFAVDCNGVGKLLYLSTLKKTVLEYKKDEVTGTIEMVRDDNGRPVQHQADTKLTKDVRAAATMGAIAKLLAGKKIKVTKVEENLPTARFSQEVVNGVTRNIPTGVRTTTLPYFEYA
jgi:hypothetical protein